MKKIYLTVIVSLISVVLALGQSPVKGKIVDKDGMPMPGVSVVIQGTTTATTTDDKGEFEINVSESTEAETGKKPKLVFSFIGSKTLVVDFDKNLSNLVMQDDINELNEVVAIGYGTQEKEDLTGSISTIKGRSITNQVVTTYDQALQGQAPGLQISSPSGELGAATRIRIRGSASVTASNDPLIVIDGFPVTSQSQTNFTDNNPSNAMADLNPNDIESVEVLKDASAAAIYGARASNGVILITTKRGKDVGTQFNLNVSSGISQATNIRKFLNRDQYTQMYRDAYKNSLPFFFGDNSADYPLLNQDPNSAFGQDLLYSQYGGTGNFTDLVNAGVNDNWNSAAYRQGSQNQTDFSVRGGNQKTKFFGSLGYMHQNGIIIRNAFERYSLRFNIDHEVNKKIKIGLNLNQVYSINNRIPENNSFGSTGQANAIAPIIPLIDPISGEPNDNTFYGNPYRANRFSSDVSTSHRNFSNMYANYNFLPNFTLRTEWGADIMNMNEKGWNGSKVPNTITTPSSGKYGTTSILNWTTNNTISFNKLFVEKHKVEALIGQSYQQSTGEFSSIQGQGLPSDNFQYLAQASQNTSFSSSWTSFSYLSYFARVNYKFDNRYILSLSARTDASSRFGTNKRYGVFPAASVGWVLTEENFIKNLNISNVINFFKIKASLGVTGNSEISDFASRGLYNSSFFGRRGGIFPNQLPNPDLTWETTTQYDVGIEVGAFNNRINGGIDFYRKNTENLLLNRQVTQTSGYATVLRNLGSMYNEGIDLYINTKNLIGDFKWSTSFNFGAYINKVTDLKGQEILPTGRGLNAILEGQPLGVFYGVEYGGVDTQTGEPLYRLADGTTTNDVSIANQRSNLKVLGNPNPKNFGGITNTFEFKGFDLSVLAVWSYGNMIYNSAGIFQSNNLSFGLDNQTVDQFNYWRQPGDVTNVPKPELYNGSTATAISNSRWISDGSFLRIRNVTFGYTIPKSLSSRIKFSTIRFYFTAQNLFTLTNYEGNDPEVNYFSPAAANQTQNITAGVDYYSAPQARTFLLGINLGF